jgi:hypothetical protein
MTLPNPTRSFPRRFLPGQRDMNLAEFDRRMQRGEVVSCYWLTAADLAEHTARLDSLCAAGLNPSAFLGQRRP